MLSLIQSLFPARLLAQKQEVTRTALVAAVMDALPETLTAAEESTLLRTVGWVSAGVGALAVGLFIGRELRQRYKFNRRTPYDFYAHSGDEQEFGVGI